MILILATELTLRKYVLLLTFSSEPPVSPSVVWMINNYNERQYLLWCGAGVGISISL
jgi:hypothetical protein